MKRAQAFLFCIGLIFLLTGCTEIMKKDKTTGASSSLEPQSTAKFSDIPVPAGFKLLAQDSYSFESGGVRVAVLRYKGKGNPEQIESFYKDQMPMYNWNFLNVVEYGERLMNFDREAETCIISLKSRGNAIALTISLGPKSQTRKKSDKPVK